MAKKRNGRKYSRRELLQKAAASGTLATASAGFPAFSKAAGAKSKAPSRPPEPVTVSLTYPRVFTGPQLKMIALPLGGIGTGTISLGGRGQLRDWEIFNRPDKGNSPDYAFAAIWARTNGGNPVARVLEAQIEPPFEGPSGLGANNVPGLPRLEGATFTGAYPLARIEFQDSALPVRVRLEAFNPLIPLDVEASALPVAILRYLIRNPGRASTRVGLAWSLQNPVGKEGKQATFRSEEKIAGLYMDNPFLSASDPLKGSFVLGVLGAPKGSVSYLRGWRSAHWWDGPLTFWDDFTADGALDVQSAAASPVASIAVTQTIPAGGEIAITFFLSWRFPNRTPKRCGWPAPKPEDENLVVGNAYCQCFADAWDAARHLARELPQLESRSRKFASAVESSTVPPAFLDAALSNLATLRTNTAFQTADGEFHGFEGCFDQAGCCHGTCTHVWNYEYVTAFVFPSLARSIRESEFLRNTQGNGLMGFRSYLPDGVSIWDHAAADGQMGCLMKLYREWQLSGDTEWLRKLWPSAKRALEFAWIPDGWDADRDGVMEGAQHNTYDVEFYGPNPLCGVWYLGALRASEEMARALGDEASAKDYRRLFEKGASWIDANLFNGRFYIQKIAGRPADRIAPGLLVGMGGADSERPQYQMGDACLCDQLLGQLMAHVVDLGRLLNPEHEAMALEAIYRNNYKHDLSKHDCVQRTYALNHEGGLLVATYPEGKRPEIPFPYFAEVWNGQEYQFAAHLIYEGMVQEALSIVESVRRRHDGEKRNPWNEPECGYHYARAMSSWALMLALGGFHYSGVRQDLRLAPRMPGSAVRSFWTAPCGWGNYSRQISARRQNAKIEAAEGKLSLRKVILVRSGERKGKLSAKLGNESLHAALRASENEYQIDLGKVIEVTPTQSLELTVEA